MVGTAGVACYNRGSSFTPLAKIEMMKRIAHHKGHTMSMGGVAQAITQPPPLTPVPVVPLVSNSVGIPSSSGAV